jgi:D-alanine-D-alanine ligase
MRKKNVALIFGGKSPEHEISVISARNIFKAIDSHQYQVTLIGISQQGKWFLENPADHQQSDFVIGKKGKPLFLMPGYDYGQIRLLESGAELPDIDVVFPITHGPNGEDGTLQGLLSHLNLPFVGPDVLGSSVAMDKDFCKRLFIQAGIKCAPGVVLHNHQRAGIHYQEIVNQLGNILFIKPANMGSSIGVSKAKDEKSFFKAIDDAFQFDTKILVEKAIVGRELECAVLGNEYPEASGVGEIFMEKGFYDFEAKYVSADEAKLYIPARDVSESALSKIRETAIKAFRCLGLEGMSRVDVFLTPDEEVIVNEVNTLPGFTSISMYPKLWEASGIPYSELINRLLSLAIDRQKRKAGLKTVRL